MHDAIYDLYVQFKFCIQKNEKSYGDFQSPKLEFKFTITLKFVN